MFQFTQEEIDQLPEKAQRWGIIPSLKKEVETLLSHPLVVPHEGVGNWGHYYYCPDCSVQLAFDIEEPHAHRCPDCGKVFHDALTDGAWWCFANMMNASGTWYLGLLWLCTNEEKYALKAKEILLEYARWYPEYKEHGDIPCNGPGRANAQTLDESNFLRSLAYGYDIVKEFLTKEERRDVDERLLRPGMEFLKKHRVNQIHNHEVICDGAIGVIALLLDDKASLSFALDEEYGLSYQLSHGMLVDGFWFECSTAYHFYALENFFNYERFARHTPYARLSDERYHKMVLASLEILKEDYSSVLLNDAHLDQDGLDAYGLLDLFYAIWHDPEMLTLLAQKRGKRPLFAFLYGEERLPKAAAYAFPDIKGETGLGATVLHRDGWFLLFRHDPYGGEHDHFDRMGIELDYHGIPVCKDLGTTGYGAPLHYGYYKHTGTHNTVCINEMNQSPSKGRLLSYGKNDLCSFAEGKVSWTENYPMPDSFSLKEWDDVSYSGVKMRRWVCLAEGCFLDVISVTGVKENRTIDCCFHFSGKRKPLAFPTMDILSFSDKEPFSHLSGMISSPLDENRTISYQLDGCVMEEVRTMENGGTLYLGEGPDNPSEKELAFQIERVVAPEAMFAHIISPTGILKDGTFRKEGDSLRFLLHKADGAIKEIVWKK